MVNPTLPDGRAQLLIYDSINNRLRPNQYFRRINKSSTKQHQAQDISHTNVYTRNRSENFQFMHTSISISGMIGMDSQPMLQIVFTVI